VGSGNWWGWNVKMVILAKKQRGGFLNKHTEARRQKIIPFVMIGIALILCINLVSAADWDNRQKILETEGLAGYKDIEIGNVFGLGKTLWSGTLNHNSNNCIVSCSATQTIALHEKGVLIDDVIFETVNPDGKRIEEPIRSYQIYVNDKPYVLGTEMEEGIYEVRLDGKKNPRKTIDWIYVLDGGITGEIELSSWALWGGSDAKLLAYWNMTNTTAEGIPDLTGNQYNLTRVGGTSEPYQTTQGLIGNAQTNLTATSYFNVSHNQTGLIGLNKSFSFLFWVNITDKYYGWATGGSTHSIFRSGNWSLDLSPTAANTVPRFSIFNGTDTLRSTEDTWLNDSEFHQIGIMVNETKVSLIIDGTINHTVDRFEMVNVLHPPAFTSERTGGSLWYTIDEAGFWNRSLTNAEIIELYNSGNGMTFSTDPTVSLNYPADSNVSSSNFNTFNGTGFTYAGATLTNMSLWINESGSWIVNQTNNTISGTTNSTIFNATLGEGSYLWGISACDTDGVCGFSSNRTMTVDTSEPEIIINTPTTFESYGSIGGNQSLNWTISDLNLDTIWYSYNGVNTTLSGAINETNITLATSPWNLTLWANDTLGNTNYTYINWTYYLFEGSSTYSSAAYETTQEELEIEVEAQPGLSAISARLWYDGVSYSSTVTNPSGDTYNATNTLEIPLIDVDGTKSFWWDFDFTLANGTDFNVNSSAKTQTVNRTWLTECNTTYTTDFVNFSVYDAENPFPIANATIKIFWEWYINTSNGNVKRNHSWENISEVGNTWSFCGSPASKSFIVDGTIEYDGVDFAKNFYYLGDSFTLSNATTNISLYLLNDSDATLTVLRVQDGAQNPLEDYKIEIQLYDIGTGNYYTVAMAETSFNGEDLAYLNWYDTLYKFIIRNPSGEIVKETEPYKISETPQTFNIITETTYDFDKFEEITYSLTFNETTNIFTLTYTKPTGVDDACLRVIKRSVYNDTEICLICKTALSATMICDVTAYGNGTYIAAFYGTGSLKLIDALSVMVDISNQVYDALGNIDATAMAIVFAGIVTVMFFISPVMGIVGVLLGMVGAVALGLQPMEGNFYFVYIGIILMGGTIAWLIKK